MSDPALPACPPARPPACLPACYTLVLDLAGRYLLHPAHPSGATTRPSHPTARAHPCPRAAACPALPCPAPAATHPACLPLPACSYVGGRSADEFLKFIEGKIAADAGFARVEAMVPVAKVRWQAPAPRGRGCGCGGNVGMGAGGAIWQVGWCRLSSAALHPAIPRHPGIKSINACAPRAPHPQMFLAVPAADKAGVLATAETAAETVSGETDGVVLLKAALGCAVLSL